MGFVFGIQAIFLSVGSVCFNISKKMVWFVPPTLERHRLKPFPSFTKNGKIQVKPMKHCSSFHLHTEFKILKNPYRDLAS